MLADLAAGTRKTGAAELSALGYRDGLRFAGPGGRTDVFFPVLRGAGESAAVLEVSARFSGIADAFSAVTILAEDEPLASLSRGTPADGPIRIPVPARLLDRPFLRVSFTADLAASRDRCFDNSLPQLWAHVAPETRLIQAAGTRPDTLGSLWSGLSGPVTLALPAQPTAPEIAAAIRAFAALERRGAAPRIVATPRLAPAGGLPAIVFGADGEWIQRWSAQGGGQLTPAATGAAAAVVGLEGAAPGARRSVLWLADPAALDAVMAPEGVLREQRVVSRAEIRAADAAPAPAASERVTFAELGLTTRTVAIGGEATIDLPFSLRDLPAGRVPRELVLLGQGPDMPSDEALLVNVFFNGQFVDSTRLDGLARLDGYIVPLHAGLLRRDNMVQLRIQHLARAPACVVGRQPVTFQIRPSSQIILGSGAPPVSGLGDWAIRRGETATVTLPSAPSALDAVPLIARLWRDAAGVGAGLQVRLGAPDQAARPAGPFIDVALSRPRDYGTVPLDVDSGWVRIAHRAGGTPLFFLPGQPFTVIQRVDAGDAAGIWILPGDWLGTDARASFAGADLALLDGGPQPILIDTRGPTVDIEYVQLTSLVSLLQRYRSWVFLGGWVLLTVIVILAVTGMRRRRGRAAG